MNIEIIGEEIISSIKFPDIQKELVDIDTIFRKTNKSFPRLLESMGLIASFDFTKRNNKKLYTHEFIKTFVEFLKEKHTTLYFFSNTLTKDAFRNTLIRKLKRIFGVLVWEDCQSISELAHRLQKRDCDVFSSMEIFLNTPHVVNFRKIKRNLDKEGLTYLHDVYFENLSNKMHIINY